jgi:hypothetical protein
MRAVILDLKQKNRYLLRSIATNSRKNFLTTGNSPKNLSNNEGMGAIDKQVAIND